MKPGTICVGEALAFCIAVAEIYTCNYMIISVYAPELGESSDMSKST